MRLFLTAFLVLAAAGCDSLGSDTQSYDGLIEVSLAGAPGDLALQLVAVDDISCDDPLVTAFEAGTLTRTVEVVGIVRPTGGTCRAIIPASAIVPLGLGPTLPGGYTVEVAHAGAIDLYHLDLGGPAPVLTAVRTTTTRLAE